MNEDQFDVLLQKHLSNTITKVELEQFLLFIKSSEDQFIHLKIDEYVNLKSDNLKSDKLTSADRRAKIFEIIIQINQNEAVPAKTKIKPLYIKLAVIAACISLFFLFNYYSNYWDAPQSLIVTPQDILLSDNQISISQGANGRIISLDSGTHSYSLGNLSIQVNDKGEISYAANAKAINDNIPISIITPKGKTSFIKFNDGTEVWVNAMSKITFKPNFHPDIREVEMEGEAFFEVASDKNRPFIVHTPNSKVQVLGTGFNISAYADDKLESTTLVHGRVKITTNSMETLLKPNQQFILNNSLKTSSILDYVDVSEFTSWKSDNFNFNKNNINEVLHLLSRWYSIDHIKIEAISNDTFTGTFKRSRSIRNILDQLELVSSYRFEINNGVVIVR